MMLICRLATRQQETFGGDLANIYRQSIKTKAECGELLTLMDMKTMCASKMLKSKPSRRLISRAYNMDYFLEDDFRTENDRLYLEITFTVNQKNISQQILLVFWLRRFRDYSLNIFASGYVNKDYSMNFIWDICLNAKK